MLGLNMTMMAAMSVATSDPAANQILDFAERNPIPIGVLTSMSGAPIGYTDATNSLNTKLINNEYFMDIMARLVRERIPERVVHAKAAGAHGYFEVTDDITNICRATLFSSVGKRTPIFMRFSPAVGIKGGMDTARDIRGLGVKFYTEDGNFDILAISTPMYLYNDPLIFPTFVRSQKMNPATNVVDPNMVWDYLTTFPEAMFVYFYVYGDGGIPDGYRHMPAYPIHTYQVENIRGEIYFVRFHILPDAGIKNLSTEKARNLSSIDYDYHTRDLYRAIGNGQFPSWTLYIQVMTLDDVKRFGYKLFDVTRIIPLNQFPLRKVGRLVLNKNIVNYFAEVEQVAFSPANLVRGILGSPDILFQSRRLAYRNAQNYRLGANYYQININCPYRTRVFTYTRDGRAPVRDNQRDFPNYFPNSFNGAVPFDDKNVTRLINLIETLPYNLDQASDYYANEMTENERSRMIENMLYSLRQAYKFLQERAIQLLTQIHPDLGRRVVQGLRGS